MKGIVYLILHNNFLGCPLTEYECLEEKYHNGDNYLTEYGLTKEECGGRCCAKGWCVGFDFTGDSAQDNSGMCHLLIDLKGGSNENLEVSNRKTVHCQKKCTYFCLVKSFSIISIIGWAKVMTLNLHNLLQLFCKPFIML